MLGLDFLCLVKEEEVVMKSTMIMVILIALLIPLVVFGQSIDNFDSEPDSGYWIHEISENADTALSYVDISYITDPVFEGSANQELTEGQNK